MNNFLIVPIFALTILSYFSISTPLISISVEPHPIDTLPRTITIYDTTSTFNSETYVETIKVSKSEVNLIEHVAKVKLSGEKSTKIHIVKYLTQDSKYQKVDENTIVLPVELWPIYYILEKSVYRRSFVKKYGKMKVRNIKTKKLN